MKNSSDRDRKSSVSRPLSSRIIKRHHVQSSQIESIGHDESNNVLEIEFKHNGAVYQYGNVSKELYGRMMTSTSFGSFFAQNIKNKVAYPCLLVVSQSHEIDDDDWGDEAAVVSDGVTTKIPVKEPEPATETTTVTAVSLRDKTLPLPEQARNYIVTNNTQYLSAAEFLKTIKAMMFEVDKTHDPVISHWHQKHKSALAEKKLDLDPLSEAETIMKHRIGGYLAAEEQRRLSEQRRLQQEAEDKIRAFAEEENRRVAEELTALGDLDGAAEAVDAPVVIPVMPVKLESTVPKVSGIGLRKNYKAVVQDMMLLVKAVAEGRAPIETLEPNMKFLGAQARAFKKVGKIYDGVVAAEDTGIAAGKD